jgi:MFS family permease
MGVAMSGFGLSGCMAPILDWGIEGYGWRAVFVAAGIATIALGVPLCLLLRHRPELYGHTVDGDPAPVDGDEGTRPDTEPAGPSLTGREAMRTRAFWLLAVLFTLSWLAFTGIVPHMVTYLTDVGIERKFAALGIMGITLATVIGRIGGGALGDRLDKRHVLVGAFLVLSVGVLLFATISQSWQLLLFLVVAGPSAGALIPIVPALIGDYFGTRSFALILGLVYAPATLIWFGVPSAAGWASDHFGTYQPAWLALAAVTFAAVPLGLMLRPPPRPTS